MRGTSLPALILLSLLPMGCGTPRAREGAPPSVPVAIQGTLQGILRQTGNAPHIEMVITGSTEAFGSGDYHVIGNLEKEIRELHPGRIRVEGFLRKVELRLAGSSGRSRTRLLIDVERYSR